VASTVRYFPTYTVTFFTESVNTFIDGMKPMTAAQFTIMSMSSTGHVNMRFILSLPKKMCVYKTNSTEQSP